MLTVLLDRREFGARPLRVDDELERIELLVLLPQPVKRLTAQVPQGLARRVVEKPQVGEFERERSIAPIQQDLSAADEGLLLRAAEEVEGRRQLLRCEHLHPFAVRLPVPCSLLVDPCYQLVSPYEEWNDRLRVGAQRAREEVLVEDLDQRFPLSDPL